MSSVDLTKTYHHLFPLPVFAEVRMRTAIRSNPSLPLRLARTRLLNRVTATPSLHPTLAPLTQLSRPEPER